MEEKEQGQVKETLCDRVAVYLKHGKREAEEAGGNECVRPPEVHVDMWWKRFIAKGKSSVFHSTFYEQLFCVCINILAHPGFYLLSTTWMTLQLPFDTIVSQKN